MNKRQIQVLALALLVLFMMGCGARQDRTKKLRDLEFSVLAKEELPKELYELTEERKQESFRFSYTDEGALYICVGYGKQTSGGCSICVTELYETENAVYIHTNLLGPSVEEKQHKNPSYPYLVVKLQNPDKAVVFE